MMYRVKINTERLVKAASRKAAILAVLKDLEIDVKFDLSGSSKIVVERLGKVMSQASPPQEEEQEITELEPEEQLEEEVSQERVEESRRWALGEEVR